MDLPQEKEFNEFIEKTFCTLIALKVYKSRNIRLRHVMHILKLRELLLKRGTKNQNLKLGKLIPKLKSC